MTKLTIVTPSYNQGKYLGDTIESVLAQNFDPDLYEYLIFDNCSTDGTDSIIEKYQDQSQIIAHVEADNGQAFALNKGFARASGSILGWINADDVYLPRVFEKVLKLFEANADADVVYGDALFMDETGTITSRYFTSKHSAKRIYRHCGFSQPSVFFRKSIFEDVGGLDESLNFALDYNLWLKFKAVGANFLYLNEYLSATRLHDQTKTASSKEKFLNEIIEMMNKFESGDSINYQLYRHYLKYNNYHQCFSFFALLQFLSTDIDGSLLIGKKIKCLYARLVQQSFSNYPFFSYKGQKFTDLFPNNCS